jgi:hypothetical protein
MASPRTPDFQLLFDGQRRIEDKLNTVSEALAKASDHPPRIVALELAVQSLQINAAKTQLIGGLFGILGVPVVGAVVSVAVHFILKGH